MHDFLKEKTFSALVACKSISDDDPEQGHVMADEVICEFLMSLGYEEIVQKFNEIEKWYS